MILEQFNPVYLPANDGAEVVEPRIAITISNAFHSRFLEPKDFNLIKYLIQVTSKAFFQLQ